jgi:CheY-like chemotaxis protein
VALKILLADDNLTAQRLGAKILTDAGHEVITVSNGAAAVKKLASDKPDMLILDVYMPGYSGLEVCAKSKGAAETAKLPVLLTVTSMEPFNAEEGNKAKADGVMIKPFVASDLLAAVEKFARKLQPPAPPPPQVYQPTMQMPAIKGFDDASYEEWKAEVADEEEQPARMAVPAEMASAPALGIEEMPVEAASAAPAEVIGEIPVIEPATFEMPAAAPAFGEEHAGVPAFEIASEAAPVPAFDVTVEPVTEAVPEAAFELQVEPVMEAPPAEPAIEVTRPEELEFTAAPQTGEVEVQLASELEPSLEPGAVEAVIQQDPNLVTSAEDMAQFTTTFGMEHTEEDEIVVGVPAPAPEPEPEPEAKISVGLQSSDDFAAEIGAREIAPEPVAPVETPQSAEDILGIAAEAVSEVGVDTVPVELLTDETGPAPEPLERVEVSAPADQDLQSAFAVTGSGAAAAPARETAPPPAPTHDELVAQFAAELEQAAKAETAPPALEGEPPAEAAMAAVPDLDEQRLVETLNAAFDRFKGDIIAAIVRQLKK